METTKRKYELTDEVQYGCEGGLFKNPDMIPEGRNPTPVYRIRALVDIPGIVEKGELGGFIGSDKNLSHAGHAWVANDAAVWGENTKISGNAIASGSTCVYNGSQMKGNALATGSSRIDNSIMEGNAKCRTAAIKDMALSGTDTFLNCVADIKTLALQRQEKQQQKAQVKALAPKKIQTKDNEVER